MVESAKELAGRFRKKFTLVLLMFISGTYMAITQNWSAESYTWFCSLLLGIFGPLDLADNGRFPWVGQRNKT